MMERDFRRQLRSLLLVGLSIFAVAGDAAPLCEGAAFGAVPKGDVADANDKRRTFWPRSLPAARQSMTFVAWGWGCSTQVSVDINRAVAYRIESCFGGNERELMHLPSPDDRNAFVVREKDDKHDRVVAVAMRTLSAAIMEQLICAANAVWTHARAPRLDENGQPFAPLPPHSVSFLWLADHDVMRLEGLWYPPVPPAEVLQQTLWGLFTWGKKPR